MNDPRRKRGTARPCADIPGPRAAALLFGLAALALQGCDGERRFARVFQISEMAQTIGGPAAAARPGDYLLENDRIRAVIHGRHNMRSTMPLLPPGNTSSSS